MKFKIQIVLDGANGQTQIEDVIQIDKENDKGYCAGLSLLESKELLKAIQKKIVLHEANSYTQTHRACPCCHKQRRIKGYDSIQFKTLFGTIVIPNLRLYQCKCSGATTKTFRILQSWLPEHISPELQYIETKWASYMSFDKTSVLLADVLPIAATHNGVTVRSHLHKTAKRQESELKEKPMCVSGCGNDWAKLPKPDKPLTIGIDGGYVRSCINKRSNFEVIIGKSFSKTKRAKRFGFVQTIDDHPQRRVLHALRKQGMQDNQQITFLSDGADNMRNLQFIMHPESEHVLDWFHLSMRFTVLNQFAKGLTYSNQELGQKVTKNLTSAKWYLWHGNVKEGLDAIEECYFICDGDEIHYKNKKKMIKHLEELTTYIENNRYIIPNYGERWRYGETIATSFVESTVNEVVTKRMVKKQQMQWSHIGAHYILQARTAALNDDLPDYFEGWYPGLKINGDTDKKLLDYKKAA
jgi:hypothetical protein